MSRTAAAATVLAVLTALMALLIAGHGPWAGAPVWQLSSNHGINAGDLPVFVIWLLGAVACLRLVRRD